MDAYTENRLKRFSDELDNITSNMENMEYYGSAEGVVFATVNGKHELLRVEITPSELYPENAERLQALFPMGIISEPENSLQKRNTLALYPPASPRSPAITTSLVRPPSRFAI